MISPAVREQFDSQVLSRLRRLRRRLRLYLALDGLAVLSIAVLASVAITLLVDRTFKLENNMRLVQLLSLATLLLATAWRFLLAPQTKPLPTDQLALLVERRHVGLRSQLISAVAFIASAEETRTHRSPALAEAAVRQASQAAGNIHFYDVLAHRRARRRAAVILGCVAILALAAALARPTMAVWLRRNLLLQNVDWPQRNRLTVQGLTDGKMIVARGDDAQVTATVDPGYEAPRQAFIEYRTDAGQTGRLQMPAIEHESPTSGPAAAPTPSPVTRFTCTFERPAHTLHCIVLGGDARTDEFTIEIVDRPDIHQITLHVTPPDYTQTAAYDLRLGQTVAQVLRGCRIGFHVVANRPIAEARLVRRIGEHQQEAGPVRRLGPAEFATEDQPPDSAVYHFRMTDVLGLSNLGERARPVQIAVRLVPDQPPTVRMRIRGAGDMILPQAVLPIDIECADAYGLASASLIAQPQKEQSSPTTQPVEGLEPGTKTFRRSIDWTPSARGFREGDRITLHAEAADFDDVGGPNVGRSQAIGLRLVTREELLADLQRREQEYRLDFERALRRQEEIYSQLLSLIDAAGALEPAERSQQLNQLARRQRDYTGRVGTVRAQFEQLLAELRVNQLATPAVESRLGAGIVEPLDRLHRLLMPAAADRLEQTPPQMPADVLQAARRAQSDLLALMRTVLANMLKWESFQEAVTLLRDIENLQKQINQETEKRILDGIIGPKEETNK